MSLDWTAILQTLGGTAILVAALAWLSKAIINHSFSIDLEKRKAELKIVTDSEIERVRRRFAEEIEEIKHQAQRDIEKYKTDLTAHASKEERIRTEVIRWANPILGAVQELENRLNNILNKAGYLALSKDCQQQIDPNWSISYSYFMQSTLYLFGQYFCWIRLLQERISFELFETPDAKDKFFSLVIAASKSLGSYPLKGLHPCEGKDAQMFALQQRGLGEALIEGETEGGRCMSYHRFLQAIEEPVMQSHLTPLNILLDGLTPAYECRWKRLEITRKSLAELADYCEELLQLK